MTDTPESKEAAEKPEAEAETQEQTTEIDLEAVVKSTVAEQMKTALSSDEFKSSLAEAVKSSFGKSIKVPAAKAEGITRESIKNMTPDEINENWDKVKQTLANK